MSTLKTNAIRNANASSDGVTLNSDGTIAIPSNKHIVLPAGTTAQRDSSRPNYSLRYNTTLGELEFWDGTNWNTINQTKAWELDNTATHWWKSEGIASNQEFQVTIGDSGGYETSGYQTATGYAGASGNHHDPSASLWKTEGSADAAGLRTGRMKLINMYGNWWHMEFDFTDTGSSPHFRFFRGTKELSGQLDRIKFNWDGGGNFDGGYIRYVKIEDL